MDERSDIKQLIILRGLPGSGKSTFAKMFEGDTIISKDNYRIKNGVYSFDKKQEPEIQKKHDENFHSAIREGAFRIILDSLNISEAKLKKYIDQGEGRDVVCVNFRTNDISLNEKRNSHNVSFDEIKRMAPHFKDYISGVYNFSISQENFHKDCEKVYRKIINCEFAKKSTNAEIELRISTISEMLVKGLGREKIIRYASAEWKVSERTTDTYLKKAWDKIGKSTGYELAKEIKLQRARLEDLYSKNYNIQDYRECRQVLDTLSKLLGINKPDKVDIDANMNITTIERRIIKPE